MRRPTRPLVRHAGFTYLGLLILLAIIAMTSAAALQVGSILQRRSAEQALLDIGTEFHNALVSYANATPAGQPQAPAALQDMLKDPRYPNTVRHLRKLYADPLTGRQEWGIVAAPDGHGIAGIYSLSTDTPIKIGNFDLQFQDFTGKTSYRDWVFMATLQQPAATTAAPAAATPAPTSTPTAAPVK